MNKKANILYRVVSIVASVFLIVNVVNKYYKGVVFINPRIQYVNKNVNKNESEGG
jgi:hypothetical protein